MLKNKRYSLLFFICMFCFIQISAQNTDSSDISKNDFVNRIIQIRKEGNVRKRAYDLELLQNDIYNFLQFEEMPEEQVAGSLIKRIKSINSKYTIYYYSNLLDASQSQVDVFAVSSSRQVYHMQEKFSADDLPCEGMKGAILELNPLVIEGTTFYSVNVSNSTGKLLKTFTDIEINLMFESIVSKQQDDERIEISSKIVDKFTKLWENTDIDADDYSSIIRMTTKIVDNENAAKVKLCTWGIPLLNQPNMFFGAVIVQKNGKRNVSILNDKTISIKNPKSDELDPRNWYGAIYYEIIPVGEKPDYYLLLGGKPNAEMTQQKLIEVMSVSNSGNVTFGKKVFEVTRSNLRRLIFEYSSAVNMMLHYNAETNSIEMDHLSPTDPKYKDNYRFYGPDFTYDKLEFQYDTWVFKYDVDLRNPKK